MITIDLPPDVKGALEELRQQYHADLIAEMYRYEAAINKIKRDYQQAQLSLRRDKNNETS